MIRTRTVRDDKRGDKVEIKIRGSLGELLDEVEVVMANITNALRAHIPDDTEQQKAMMAYVKILKKAEERIVREMATNMEQDPETQEK